jgi:hypothetical protein
MKSIALDFDNNMICIMTAGQQGTEQSPNLKKVAFSSFIPKKYIEYNSFTWNFENETFAVNQPYILHDGCIMTQDCFVPEMIFPMPGLKKRFDEFIAILGYEEVDLKAEMPAELRKLLGLD